MPVWHQATKELTAEGKLVVLGIVQEQHAERARLYAQWKQFDFPILQDAVTENGLAAVPVAVFVDEFGVVQNSRARPGQLAEFMEAKFERPAAGQPPATAEHRVGVLRKQAQQQNSVGAWTALGDAILKFPPQGSTVTQAIEAYRQARALKPSGYAAASLDFRTGVAYRARHDSLDGQRGDSDFRSAVEHWTAALAANPNQYIWRRRIQQYGPRQSKPYPFYDWVEQAVEEIRARGERPVELTVPLSGAEVAQPSREWVQQSTEVKHPDPDQRLALDALPVTRIQTTVVPAVVQAGESARVHVRFQLASGKWNNEADPMVVWIDRNQSVAISRSAFQVPNADLANSIEDRVVEFECRVPADAKGSVRLTAFTCFNHCVDEEGTCRYLRRNFEIEIPVRN